MCTNVTLVIMACNLDSESSDENEFSIQPYMFDPKYSKEKLPRDEDKKVVSTGEPATAEEGDSLKIFTPILYTQPCVKCNRFIIYTTLCKCN